MSTDFLTNIKSIIVAETEAANEAAKVILAQENLGRMIDEIVTDEESEHEEVLKYLKYVEVQNQNLLDARAGIEKWAESLLPSSEISDEEREAATTAYAAHKSNVDGAKKLAPGLEGYSPDFFADVPDLLTLKGTGKSGSPTGIKRPRLLYFTVDGKDEGYTVKKDKKTNTVVHSYTITSLAAYLTKMAKEPVTGSALQAEAFAQAGTDDLSTKSVVDFPYSLPGGKVVQIRLYPSQGKSKYTEEATSTPSVETADATASE